MTSSCPVDHSKLPASARRAPEKPRDARTVDSWFRFSVGAVPRHTAAAEAASREAARGPGPVGKGSLCPVSADNINPKNMMPYDLSQSPLRNSAQRGSLPQQRTVSSIPRSETDKESVAHGSASSTPVTAASVEEEESHWVYPSAQQFYNALARKGYETNESDIPVILAIHNDLNEQSWQQVCQWERESSDCVPKLVKFIGRPTELSPKARFYSMLGSPKPFDRHDWVVDRCGKHVRYILDYYEAPHVPGQANFFVDCRPAADSVGNMWARLRHYVRPSVRGPVSIS